MAQIYSTLEYAKKERFKTRDYLIRLGFDRDQYLLQIENEKTAYQKLAQNGGKIDPKFISKGFATETAHFLIKEVNRAQP